MINLSPDIVNGIFEFIGALFSFANCWQLFKDKKVKGVHWGSTIFFTSWGLWNLFYYPSLHQPYSFVGGIFLCCAAMCWMVQRIYYDNKRYVR